MQVLVLNFVYGPLFHPHRILYFGSKSTVTHDPATMKICASLIVADWPKKRIIQMNASYNSQFGQLKNPKKDPFHNLWVYSKGWKISELIIFSSVCGTVTYLLFMWPNLNLVIYGCTHIETCQRLIPWESRKCTGRQSCETTSSVFELLTTGPGCHKI